MFPISEKDQKKIWSQSKRLLQESASPLGTFEIERKTLGPSSESDDTAESSLSEKKSLKSESIRTYFNRSIKERSKLEKSVMKYHLKRLSQKPKILGSTSPKRKKKKKHGFESPTSKLGLVKTVYETSMKKGFQSIHRTHPKLDEMREEKFGTSSENDDDGSPSATERTRNLSAAVSFTLLSTLQLTFITLYIISGKVKIRTKHIPTST